MQTTLGTNLESPDLCMNNHNAEPTYHPMSKGRNHTILRSAGEKLHGKTQENMSGRIINRQWFLCEDGMQLHPYAWMNRKLDVHERGVGECFI